ncbi:hypothetical protein [Ferrovibrio sp.]|uniref:hypothetical protein n=1 Tax=Ferrovibrio sp. TaxID=1917215 RepID=UPI0025BAD9BD|nr:hypothetical protein [Ferrovibrio sp.]
MANTKDPKQGTRGVAQDGFSLKHVKGGFSTTHVKETKPANPPVTEKKSFTTGHIKTKPGQGGGKSGS